MTDFLFSLATYAAAAMLYVVSYKRLFNRSYREAPWMWQTDVLGPLLMAALSPFVLAFAAGVSADARAWLVGLGVVEGVLIAAEAAVISMVGFFGLRDRIAWGSQATRWRGAEGVLIVGLAILAVGVVVTFIRGVATP